MKKNNKNFIIVMVGTAVVGLVILMTMMLLGVKYYVGQTNETAAIQESSLRQEEKESAVEYSATIIAVVTDLADSEIKAVDIESNQSIAKPIHHTTKVADAYGKTIPLSSIKKGDIVEIVYQEDKDRTISISKSKEAWTKSKVSGVKVNQEASELELFGSVYTYGKTVVAVKADGTETEMGLIKSCDIVTVQGIKDRVFSVRVEEAAGSINIVDIPNRQGRVELDINTMIPLSEISGMIDVVPGKHKVAVHIKGYENFIEEIEVAPGEVYEISLDSAKRAYTNVKVAINNVDVEEYNIKIGNTTYAKGDKISVAQGAYEVTITAENYKPWTKTIAFANESYTIKATLQSDKVAENTASSTETSTSEAESNNEEATSETRTIDISTDPSGAKVYINGINKGTTPYKVTLPIGSYSILLEKDGYEVYSTSIILDGSDDQTGFLYVLTPHD